MCGVTAQVDAIDFLARLALFLRAAPPHVLFPEERGADDAYYGRNRDPDAGPRYLAGYAFGLGMRERREVIRERAMRASSVQTCRVDDYNHRTIMLRDR